MEQATRASRPGRPPFRDNRRDAFAKIVVGALLAFCASASAAPAPAAGAGEAQFREVYKELVETNTTLSAGSCTRAADRMAARLKSAGFTDADLYPFAMADHPQEGGLVAIYPGSDRKLKAILLLAHIDVVEAKREDWVRDPFTLVEENGNFRRNSDLWNRTDLRWTGPRPYPWTERVRQCQVAAQSTRISFSSGEGILRTMNPHFHDPIGAGVP